MVLSPNVLRNFQRGDSGTGIVPLSAEVIERSRARMFDVGESVLRVMISPANEISARTVKFHFAGIRSKLAAANRQEAIAKAMSAGLISP
jgi:hypothetical protein